MREFKFIRGKYTDENIFNSDETAACLFAYDKAGNLVNFAVKNNKEFQDNFANLSYDRLSEIYTIRPSQFTVSAKKESSGDYSYTFELNKKVFDDSESFPENVVAEANAYMKTNTTAVFNTSNKIPILNLANAEEKKTPMKFTFNDKTFTKDLIFKVSGYLNERGYVAAQGENLSAYPTVNGIINYDDKELKSGAFHSGRLQKLVKPETYNIVSDTLSVDEGTSLSIASKYTPKDGYAFIYGGVFADEINYADNLTFVLYKRVLQYLISVTADVAVAESNAFVNTTSDKYTLNNVTFSKSTATAPADNTTYYEIVNSGSVYASYVNKKPSKVLTKADTIFFSSIKNNMLPVNVKLSGYANAVKSINIESDFAYVKNANDWTSAAKNSKITVKYYYNTDTEIKSVTISGSKYIINGNSKTPVADAAITYKAFYNNEEITDYKYFIVSTPTMYVPKSDVSSVLNNITTAGTLIKMEKAETKIVYSLKKNYVAYEQDKYLVPMITSQYGKVFMYSEDIIENIKSENYNFYKKAEGYAYYKVDDCKITGRDTKTIVKGYKASYSGLYILGDGSLRSLADNDLTGTSINVYTSKNHNVVGSNVYDNVSDNTTKYVVLSKTDWLTDVEITKDNAYINDNNIPAPKITENTLRLITSVKVNATQSD